MRNSSNSHIHPLKYTLTDSMIVCDARANRAEALGYTLHVFDDAAHTA